MESFILVVVLIVLFVRWLVLSSRMKELKGRVEVAERWANQASQIGQLTERIHALELMVKEPRPMARAAAVGEPPVLAPPQPEAAPVPPPEIPALARESAPVVPPVLPEIPVIAWQAAEPVLPPVVPPEITVSAPPLPPTLPPQIPAFAREAEPVREPKSAREWEAIVGGNWINKLGVFLLVIGLALLLGYGFTKMGPAGHAAMAVGVSVVMLGAGAFCERRAQYRIFGRGLLGGGWASLYFTVYAMQTLDAARVIYNPCVGGVLLLAVATGMILHSLRYRSQTVTGLAYFLAFVTLAITPVNTLSVIALIPLAASLLYIAHRFSWSVMALFGLIATYGTCASRGDSGAPLWQAQTLFAVYWLLFEGFDLLRAARRSEYSPWESAILPLNAIAFTGLSYAKWSAAAPGRLYILAAGIGAAYLVSTILRSRLRPPSSFAAETNSWERATSGGYEGPVTLTAILSTAAVFLKFPVAWANLGLLVEAEIFFLAGLFFRESYPRHLAAAMFAGGLGKLLVNDIGDSTTLNVAGRAMKWWTPVTALSGLLFYVNRALRSADKFYGYAGSAVFAFIIGFETPQRYLGGAWLIFGAMLFTFGWLRRLNDFRMQGYIGGALGLGGTGMYQLDVLAGTAQPMRYPWISLAGTAVLTYAAALCGLRSAEDRLQLWERKRLRHAGTWAATVALLALAWSILQGEGEYLGLAWMLLALPLLELGLRDLPSEFRVQSYVVAALGVIRVLFLGIVPVSNDGPLYQRLLILWSALAAYALAARIYKARQEAVSANERGKVFDVSSAIGTIFLLTALWALLPSLAIGPAWAAVALLLLEIGLVLGIQSLRLQGHLAGAAAFGRLFLGNFTSVGTVGIISARLLTVVPVLAAEYYQWSRQRAEDSRLKEWERPLASLYLYAAAILAVALMRFELGRVFAVTGWAALAVIYLYLGQRWANRDFRMQSYLVAALAFVQGWATGFNAPDAFSGLVGRVAACGFVIACLYAAQLMVPLKRSSEPGFERHARLYYSALATVLLTVFLFHEVSGSMLTVAWGIEGVILLVAGFPLTDRVLRLSGLALFLICILKLFFYDLRHLETLYRIVSFIALGLILVSVSWMYTRFRDRIQRYL